MDTVLAARLSKVLFPLVPSVSRQLIGFEHEVAEICAYMERNGFLIDVEYTEGPSKRLKEEEECLTEVAAKLVLENVNSTEQVADGLEAMGVKIKDRTPSGKRKVDKKLLESLEKEGNELAKAVTQAKKARKWRTTWVDGFLANRDENDQIGRAHV